MTRGWRPRGKVVLIAWSLMVMALAATEPASTQVPGACNAPVSQRLSEVGCYLTASAVLGSLGPGPVFWHLYTYPTQAAAEAVKGPHGTVVESFGKAWLYTIASEGWRPSSGERVAVLGPLAITSDKKYTARYMEAVFKPGMRAAIHRHSGPEAWYLISGAQCLETPDGITVARAGVSQECRHGDTPLGPSGPSRRVAALE